MTIFPKDDHISQLGPMTDLASPASSKAIGIGILFCAPGIALEILSVCMVFDLPNLPNRKDPLGIMPLIPLGIGWYFLANGASWIHVGTRSDWYLRAGPGGVAVRVPGNLKWHGLGYKVVDVDISWRDIRGWQAWLLFDHGIPREVGVIIWRLNEDPILVTSCCFAESRHELAAIITYAARSLIDDETARARKHKLELLAQSSPAAIFEAKARSLPVVQLSQRARRTTRLFYCSIILMFVGCLGPISLIPRISNEVIKGILGITGFFFGTVGLIGAILMAWDWVRYRRLLSEKTTSPEMIANKRGGETHGPDRR